MIHAAWSCWQVEAQGRGARWASTSNEKGERNGSDQSDVSGQSACSNLIAAQDAEQLLIRPE